MAMPPESAVPSDVPLLQLFVTAVTQCHAVVSEIPPMIISADNSDAFILPGLEDVLPFPSGRYSMLVKLLEVSRHDHAVAGLLPHQQSCCLGLSLGLRRFRFPLIFALHQQDSRSLEREAADGVQVVIGRSIVVMEFNAVVFAVMVFIEQAMECPRVHPMRQRLWGVLSKQVWIVIISLHVFTQTTFQDYPMKMSTGCPWACCFCPPCVASKANLAIAASAIERCLAIVARGLHLPNNIVKAVSVIVIPIDSLPVHLVLKDAKRRLDHFEIIDSLNSTNKAQEARLLCKSSIVPGPSWQIGCQVSR